MQNSENAELKVFISKRESVCGECGEDLGRNAWIMLAGEKGALCLACADLDHLVFLAAGDTALTRRSRKYSSLSAVVLKWSRARERYERQGLLVETEALEKAEKECLGDEEIRIRRRERDAIRREEVDHEHATRFAVQVRALFPGCPPGREEDIADHACRKYSGRIGRSAFAKALDDEAVRLAVVAHVRHRETDYDKLLAMGEDRWKARREVQHEVNQVMRKWQR